MKYFILNNGIKMPVIGLGTFPMKRLELFKVFFKPLLVVIQVLILHQHMAMKDG